MKLSEEDVEKILEEANFENGLVTAVVRNVKDDELLMVAFMNEEALRRTLTTGWMTYWSRSREELWQKGEKSGNRQKVKEVWIDCDGDAFLFDVVPEGPACHKGYKSCFFRKIEDGKISQIMERKFDPEEVYD